MLLGCVEVETRSEDFFLWVFVIVSDKLKDRLSFSLTLLKLIRDIDILVLYFLSLTFPLNAAAVFITLYECLYTFLSFYFETASHHTMVVFYGAMLLSFLSAVCNKLKVVGKHFVTILHSLTWDGCFLNLGPQAASDWRAERTLSCEQKPADRQY